jgi:hypothetical protein
VEGFPFLLLPCVSDCLPASINEVQKLKRIHAYSAFHKKRRAVKGVLASLLLVS